MGNRAGEPAESSGREPREKKRVRGGKVDKKGMAENAGRSSRGKRPGSMRAGRTRGVKRSESVSTGRTGGVKRSESMSAGRSGGVKRSESMSTSRSGGVKRSESVSAGRSGGVKRSGSVRNGNIRRSGSIVSGRERILPAVRRGKREREQEAPERSVFSQDGQKKSISLVLAVAVVVILVVAVSINVWTLGRHLRENNARIEEVRKELASEEQRSADIEEYRRYTETDSYIEEIAREKLGLIYEGETVFKEDK